MAKDILKLLNTNKEDIKKLFKNIIIKVENDNDNSNNIITEDNNFINNLLKYKNYLNLVLPLLIIN